MSSTIDNSIPPELLEAILNDPDKRQLVLKLLNKTTTTTTTQNPKKRKQQHFESPVALFRRRALEKLNSSDSSIGSTDTDVLPPPGPKVPYERLLEGVVAFVDVRRDNVDKSSGIKLVMESMGAVVKEKLAKGVTHVVFKDADYTTFYAARLLKCHLVSVLWLDAIRKKGYRVPEKNYPAFGGDDANASVLCSQIQKEFDDIIKEEKRRSYDGQTIQKEHLTLTTPIPSKSSYGSAKSTPQQSIGTDSEIVDIVANLPTNNFVEISTPDLTSDDSDCGVVNGYTSSHLKGKKLSCFETSSSFDTTKSTEPSQSLIKGFKRYAKSPGSSSSSTRSTRTTEQLQTLISGVKRPAKSPGGGSSSSGRGVRTNNLIKEGLDRESSDIAKTTPTDRSINDTTTSVSTRSTNRRRSSRSRSRTINILSDVILQTQSTISDDNGTLNRSKKLKKSTINDESSDRTKTLPTNISSSTNNRSSRKKSTINDESSDRTKTLSTNISSKSSHKKSTINDESSDRTKTISTEKSMNVSTNQSDNNSIMSPLRLSSGLERNIDENDIPTTMSSLRLSSNSKNSNKENSDLLANLNRVDVKEKDNDIDEIKEKERKVIRRRRLFDPETVVCTPRNDDLEREERIRFLEAKEKHLQINRNIKLRNSSKGEKRKKDESSDNISSSSDEDLESPQKQQPTVRRCSQRLSIAPRPISYNKNNNNNNRRSSLEFQCSTETRKKIRTRIDPTKVSSIVCTRFHREEVVEFIKIVKKLGVFHVEQQVTKKTTHLIAGESKRTINMLRALARGCWILKREWLDKSFEQGRWLPEEDYEFTEFSPAVQQCRLQRQAFGPNYTIDIFVNCGKIYVSNNTTPGRDELRQLIEICKGQLTNVYRNADIVIGQYVRSSEVICVNETWVLDSIQANKLRSVKKYLIKIPGSPHY